MLSSKNNCVAKSHHRHIKLKKGLNEKYLAITLLLSAFTLQQAPQAQTKMIV